MADEKKRKEAIDAVARHLACIAIDTAINDADVDYPDLDDDDRRAVCDRAHRIATGLAPQDDYFKASYEYLGGSPWEVEP